MNSIIAQSWDTISHASKNNGNLFEIALSMEDYIPHIATQVENILA